VGTSLTSPDDALFKNLWDKHISAGLPSQGLEGFRPSASKTFSRGLQLRKTATRKLNVTFIAFPLGERQRVVE
jgi:hypothetical protein